MDCDLLLSWMTHIGEGSWARFRNAVEELAGKEADLADLCRKNRIVLSDLGFADFFVEDTQRWRMLPPLLGGLALQDGAILCGSRTPILVESLKRSAATHGCELTEEKLEDCPTLIRLSGEMEQLAKVACDIETPFEPNLSGVLVQGLLPIKASLDNASQEPAPLNWKVRSLDFRTCAWVDEILPNSAYEYTPTYGRPKFFIRLKHKGLLRLSKRESVYAAAMLNRVRLIEYDGAAKLLKVPLFAPLPELYSRVACLCSGQPAQVIDGRIAYGLVPPDLASFLMVAVGQPHPEVELLAGARR